jgi:hypothetical protein
MDELCYLPKPAEFESPKSLLMRMAYFNGFGTVKNMCFYFACTPRRWIDLLDQRSILLDIVAKQAPGLAASLRSVFYSVPSPPTSIKAGPVYLPRGSCAHHWYYCPACIEAAHAPIFHDLPDVSVCLLHGLQLITACPNCHTNELWCNAELFHCRCGFERRGANRINGDFMPAVADPFQAHSVVEEISLKYDTAQLCAALWEARRSAENTRCCSLPFRVIKHIEMTVATQLAHYPGFIRPLHMAPWTNAGTATVAWLANRALHRLHVNDQACPAHHCCQLATIDRRNMLRAIFGEERADIETVLNYDLDQWTEKQSPYIYSGLPRCQIIRKANAEYCPTYIPQAENLAGLTKDEVATLLKCSLSTVGRLQNQGWFINPAPTIHFRLLLPDVINQPATKEFAQQYILLDELCNQFDLPTYLCDHLMRAAGLKSINPYFEPKFYHRATVLVMLNHLQSHHSVRKAEIRHSTDAMETGALRDIQYILSLTATLRKYPPAYTSYQAQNYIYPITDSSDIDSDALEPHFFDVNEVFNILGMPLCDGLAALGEVGMDLHKLPRANSNYSLIDIEVIRDIIGISLRISGVAKM